MQTNLEPWQVNELRKCARSFSYFAETYVKILHPRDGLIPFKLYGFQERVIRDFAVNKYTIVRKFRQAGLTTVAVVWGFWRCLFDLDQRVLVLSKSDREAIAVGKIIKYVKDYLPEWLQPRMSKESDHEKEFADTNGIMWFYTCEAARSKSVTFAIIDEAAFIKNMHEYWKAIYPTLSTGGSCAVISTVNGVGNWYEETYTRAVDQKNQFKVIDLHYTEHPDYNNPEWERITKANLGEKGWLQEVLGQFQGSGDTYVPLSVLKNIEESAKIPMRKLFPEWDTSPTEFFNKEDLANIQFELGAMWVWEEPTAGQEYIISADCATGHGGNLDANAFHVFNLVTFEQVAEFQSNTCTTFEFAQVLARAGAFYNECCVVVENDTGPGLAVLDRLVHNLRYPNLYFSPLTKSRDKPGFTIGRNNRQLCLETMRSCLTNSLIRVNSARLVRELNTFIVDGTTQKARAANGKHDDLVMAFAIGLHVTNIMNRDMPIGAPESISKDIISNSINGKSMDKIRAALEDGIDDDFLELYEYEDILPRPLLTDTSSRKRPQEALLKMFGW